MSDVIGFLALLTIPAFAIVLIGFYFLAIGGWRDFLDFLDAIEARRARKKKR